MGDKQLKDLVSKLVADKKVMGLVKLMQPTDVIAVISTDLDLQDEDAENVVANLIQHAHGAHYEGMASPGIEKLPYPVPSSIRRDNTKTEDISDLSPHQFPPDPREEPKKWPYDAMTKAGMDPKFKGKRKPLMQGPFDPNLKKNRPGGDAGANALQSAPQPHADNSYHGRAGWSSTPPGKEYDLPERRR